MATDKITLIIVDDHPLVRHGIMKILEKEESIHVAGEAESADEAMKLCLKDPPDVALIDISLKGRATGIDLIKALQERCPAVKTLVISMHDEIHFTEASLKAGAGGYITKKEASESIVQAIESIYRGELYLSRELSLDMVNSLMQRNETSDSLQTLLSEREMEIFELIGRGTATGEIARKLHISVNTIESHRRNIKKKLKVQNSSELVKKAVQWQLTRTLDP